MKLFSIVVPVYNRTEEALEFIKSLENQTNKNFELIVVDGSPDNVFEKVDQYAADHNLGYAYERKHVPGLGISASRNLGTARASGKYLIFFDSDVIVPDHYFSLLESVVQKERFDLFGGPDAAHPSFSVIQKSINYCMTSFLTTGGIRGGRTKVSRFTPRGFNLGIRKKIFDTIGGYDPALKVSEDVDLSARAIEAGAKVGLIPEAFVYHKRRVSLLKFFRQVYRFGAGRIFLSKKHRGELKLTHFFPVFFILFTLSGIIWHFAAPVVFPLWGGLIMTYLLVNVIMATLQNRSLAVGLIIVPTLFIQFIAYAWGFCKNGYVVNVLGKAEGIFSQKRNGPESPV